VLARIVPFIATDAARLYAVAHMVWDVLVLPCLPLNSR
jgi:hypothetical protein